MKKLALLTVAALSCTSLFGSIFKMDPTKLLKKGKAGRGFEMKNKTKGTISVGLSNKERLQYSDIKKNQVKEFTIDISKPTNIAIWYSKPKKPEFGAGGLLGFGEKIFTPKPDKYYTFTPGKTIYLKWSEGNVILPQKGILKKTTTGLSLKNNVTKNDIKELNPETGK